MTRSDREMEALLGNLEPGSPRYVTLKAAREFKAAWVAMGETLTRVREKDLYKGWGYSSFEQYCRRELHLKQDTANKLTRSFAFLRDHEPKVLDEREVRELPPLDVVDLMSRAREKAKISDDQFAEIREEVFEPEGKIPTKNQVMKRIRELDPQAFKPAAKKPVATGGPEDLRKALLLAERLYALVDAQPDISDRSVKNMESVVAELRKLFEANQEAKQSA